jgi:hypothetical protein
MKISLIVLIFIYGLNLYGQTDSIEKAALHWKLANSTDQAEYKRICKKWDKTILEIKKYPDLPLDQSGLVHYSYLNQFKNVTKEKLFNRILEWLSVTYGLFPSYIYSNPEDGKIIFKNSITLKTGHNCNYTAIISVKNEKILMEFFNIGYSQDQTDRTVYFDINQVYPVILKDPSEWSPNLKLLKTTNDFFNADKENLSNYILHYDSIYTF